MYHISSHPVVNFLRKANIIVLTIALTFWAIAMAYSSGALASSEPRVEDLAEDDVELTILGENIYGFTLTADISLSSSYTGPLTNEELLAKCNFNWYDVSSTTEEWLAAGQNLDLNLGGRWDQKTIECRVTRDNVQETYFVKWQATNPTEFLNLFSAGDFVIDQSSANVGDTVTISLNVNPILTAITDPNDVFEQCSFIWDIDGVEYPTDNYPELTIPNDESLYGKTITCNIEASPDAWSIEGKTNASGSVVINTPVVPPTPTPDPPTPTPEPEPTPTPEPVTPVVTPTVTETVTETISEPVASAETSQSSESAPIIPIVAGVGVAAAAGVIALIVALGGGGVAAAGAAGAAGVAVAGTALAGAAGAATTTGVAATAAAGSAAGTASATGAAGAAGAAGGTSSAASTASGTAGAAAKTFGATEARIAARAARALTLKNAMKAQRIAFCTDGLEKASAVAKDLDKRPLISVKEMNMAELTELIADEKRVATYHMVVLPLIGISELPQLNERISTIKSAAPKLKVNVLAHLEEGDDALKAELDTMRESGKILCYASENANGDDVHIRFILPLYKNFITGDDAVENANIAAMALGLDDVSTALSAYSTGKDVKTEAEEHDIDAKKAASNAYNIADVLGYNGFDTVANAILTLF